MNNEEWDDVNPRGTDIKNDTYKDKPISGVLTARKQITTKFGDNWMYSIATESEGMLAIYGFTALNRAMDYVQEGQPVRITYLGKKLIETQFGKKEAHQVRVQVQRQATSMLDNIKPQSKDPIDDIL